MICYNLSFYTYFYGSDNNPAFKIPELPSLKYKCYYYYKQSIYFWNVKGYQLDWNLY